MRGVVRWRTKSIFRLLQGKPTIFALIGFLFIARVSYKRISVSNGKFPCSPDDRVLFQEEFICEKEEHKRRYLSYQPPGGGWNNQRVALENAIVISRILNRTLIVQPVAPHAEILRVKAEGNIPAGFHVYNSLNASQVIPLSNIIDFRHLSRFVPVKEVLGKEELTKKYGRAMSWRRVCHNGFVLTWVDQLPKRNSSAWKRLSMRRKKGFDSLPSYRQFCYKEMELSREYAANFSPFWGILDELENAQEEIVYFEQGSLYVREILFTNKARALDATRVVMWSLKPSYSVQTKVNMIIREIGHPFNAIHVRRTDHPTSNKIDQNYWIRKLAFRKALGVTNKLYVATDEVNKTWFEPFRDAGYKLFFAEDFEKILNITCIEEAKRKDIQGIHEQLTCTYANVFVGSYYSTFTLYIERMRKATSWHGIELDDHTGYKWIGSSRRT